MGWIEWKDSYRLGIPAVDYEHQEMIALLNDLYEGLQGEVDSHSVDAFLGQVYARISAHFALEERVMRDRDYDQYADHKSAHESLLDEIREIMDEHDTGAFENAAEILAERLQTWFTEHFRTHDARLHSQLGPDELQHGEI
jgi:hemerythrin-like metal-binding protein